MKGILFFIGTALFLSTFAIGTVFAAADPIADFCASSTATADAQARKECEDLKSLQVSNTKIQGEKTSIQKEIALIDGEISVATQKIKVQERIITQLTGDIGIKSKAVTELQAKINREVASISALLQKVSDHDSTSVAEVLMGRRNFSDFYTEVDALYTLNRQLTALIEEIKSVKTETEEAKQALEDRKEREADARDAIQAEKRLIDRRKADKNVLLASKNNELGIAQKLLSDQKAKVAQIRSRLFKFQDGEGIPFGDAYDFAVKAEAKTGVRPALILAVLTQESSKNEDGLLGTNIGSCYVKNLTTGDGVGKNTGRAFERIMYSASDTKRPSDTAAFEDITSRLGRDWSTTPVSCPPDPRGDGKYYVGRGFGGGMGPTQFIPSTWELIKKKVGTAVGIPADDLNPWSYEHAIMATAVLLKDAGARAGATYSSERNSACIYYSGAKCTPGRKPANVFYGDQVMAKAVAYQADIDEIAGR